MLILRKPAKTQCVLNHSTVTFVATRAALHRSATAKPLIIPGSTRSVSSYSRRSSSRGRSGTKMYVAAITAFLGVAAAAPLPTTWPAPHNTSTQCVHMLAKHKLDWLLEPFTCTKAQKTSNAHIVLGTGLGGTGTRSVASAVDKLGYPACHSYRPCGNQNFKVLGPMARFHTGSFTSCGCSR